MDQSKKYLYFSLILDVFGFASFAFPVLGETSDFIFGPIYGACIFYMYRRNSLPAFMGGVVGAIEEILPWSDFIPSATIMWLYTYKLSGKKELKS